MNGLGEKCLLLCVAVCYFKLCWTKFYHDDESLRQGHVSKTDRKYLTKGMFYLGSGHYWPLDYETQLRDVKYSRDGRQRGTGVSITGGGRGYLSISGKGWVRLGKSLSKCVCDASYCKKNGMSVGLWVKLSNNDKETKILLGSDTNVISNTSGLVIFQTTRTINGTQTRYISAIVFMKNRKWKCHFPVQPGSWFYLTVTWSNRSGLRMFKDGALMSEQSKFKRKVRVLQPSEEKCAITLSPPTAHGTTLSADYDDLVIWYYELKQPFLYKVYRNSIGFPKIVDCNTNGTSLDIVIEDKYQIYDIKRDFKITWWRSGGDQKETRFAKDLTFTIPGLVENSEYIIEIERRMFLSVPSKEAPVTVFSRPLKFTCSTKPYVPTRPKNFKVREKAEKYLMLQWQHPDKIYGSILSYKISYRVDDFQYPPNWTDTFRANVKTMILYNLTPFTDYVIKLSCVNENGSSKAATLRATTAEGVPTRPQTLKVKLKGEMVVAKWQEPKKLNGLVHYRLFALVNGTKITICSECGEWYKLEDGKQYTNYTFWVIAYNINNDPRYESGPSDKVTIITPSYTPTSPRNVTVSFTQSGVNVQWERSSKPRGRIDYKLHGLVNTSKRIFCDECGLQYSMKDVERNTVYTFWVVAYNVYKDYVSQPTDKVTIDTASYVPTIPGELRINVILEGILISWNKSLVPIGSIRYQLIGLENGFKREFCSDCGLRYLINESKPNTNYSFWVVAHNIQNGYESLPSAIVHFYTARSKPFPPEHIMVPDVSDSSAKIVWTPPEGSSEKEEIIGYKVTLYNAFSVLRVEKTKSLQLQFTNLTQFSKYYVTVEVLSTVGYGLPSQQLTIHTKDANECAMIDVPCGEHAQCINSAGSYFCSCVSGYVGDGVLCQALPSEVTAEDFCSEALVRNVTWKKTYHGNTDKNLCPEGTIGISTRECLKGNGSKSYWSDPNLSNCVSDWMAEVDDKLADRTLNSTAVGNFFLNLLDNNDGRGLYGGDVIKSVNVIDLLYNKSKDNELDEEKSNPRIAETLLMNLINITEKIISPEKLKVWTDIPKERRTEHSVKIMDGLDNAVLKSANIVNFSSIRNEYINVRYGKVSNFKPRNNLPSSEKDDINSVKLPQQEKDKDNEDRVVAIIKYNTISHVLLVGDQVSNDESVVNSAVLSISMNPPLSIPFQKPLEFKLSNQKDGNFDKHQCVFLSTSRYPGFWSANGCNVFNVTDNYTVCHCYHMTSFSVLMQVKPAELSYSDELILSWITRVGLCISLVALGLSFLTFVFLPRPCGSKSGSRCFKLCEQGYRPTYLKKVRSGIHANLILSLALAEALFLWGVEKTQHKTTCYTIAVALHYLFLVAFHWMAAEGVILYLVLVKVFQRKSAKKDKRMFMIICWGTPAAIVCTALVVGHEYYLDEKYCWLSVAHGMIWGFVGPALAIILVNVFFLCCTFYVMAKRQSWAKADKNMVAKIRYWAKGAAIVTCLLGVTWVFGVFFLNSDSVAVTYIFNICNVFQGLFIFVFHCLLDEKIRQQYYQVLCAVTNFESRSPTHSTGTAGKKEQRRSTFNSWLWSVSPMKLQDSKSESCPTVGENTLKRLNSSTHSLSPYIDRRLMEIKRDSDTMRPRGMSSIYHDSDENMDNIPDNILTVKHGSKNNSGKLYFQDEDTTGGVFEDNLMTTLSRENSREFYVVPEATCEDCLYEIKEWEEQQEIVAKTNSFHEQELKTLKAPCNVPEQDYLNQETSMDDELCQENIKDKEEQQELLPHENAIKQSYISIVPHIVLSDFSKSKNGTSPKRHRMVDISDTIGAETSDVPSPTAV